MELAERRNERLCEQRVESGGRLSDRKREIWATRAPLLLSVLVPVAHENWEESYSHKLRLAVRHLIRSKYQLIDNGALSGRSGKFKLNRGRFELSIISE